MEQKKSSLRSRLIWFFVFLALVALTFYAIVGESDSFSSGEFTKLLRNASVPWLIAAVVCMLGFILFEAFSLRVLESFFGYPRPIRKNVVYTCADIYFSAITPSATGGQPASAMFMIRHGIPAATTTIILLVNLTLYTVSLLIIGLLCFLFAPSLFLSFSPASRILITLGFALQSLFVVGLSLLVLKEKIILKIANWGLNLLHKLHLIKNVEKKQESLHRMAQEYRECIGTLRKGKWMTVKVLFLNLMQRFCNIGVTLCIFLAIGGSPTQALTVLFIQGYVLLGSNSIPIPGAVGLSDILFLDGFATLIPENTACVELMSRGVSFYICLILSGIIVLTASCLHAAKKRRERKQA